MSAVADPGSVLRAAVTQSLRDLDARSLVLVGCSGGSDSLALAAAAASVQAAGGPRAGAIVVDHQLQPGSAAVARAAAATCRTLGLDPVEVATVEVPLGPGHGGLEAAARDARRAALREAAQRFGAAAVLLAHTLDDQAETVLLGLARGSGARSLAGMARADGLWRRPLLDVPRAVTRAAARLGGPQPHEDPHNYDHTFARVRVRVSALPALESALGPGVPAALARSAALLRDDADALDQWTQSVLDSISLGARPSAMPVADLADLPNAVRTRVIRRWLIAQGVPGAELSRDHVLRAGQLITNWRGQGAIRLPGARDLARRSRFLVIEAVPSD